MKMTLALMTAGVLLVSGYFVWAAQDHAAQPVPDMAVFSGKIVALNQFMRPSPARPDIDLEGEPSADASKRPASPKPPLGLDTANRLYLILGDTSPSGLKRLGTFLDKNVKVQVKGHLFEKKGLSAIQVEEIQPDGSGS